MMGTGLNRIPVIFALFQICSEELIHFIKGDDISLVIEVGVACAGNEHQFLVFPFQFLKSVLAEIAGVCLIPVNQKDGASDFITVLEDRHIQEGQGGGDIPSIVGVQRTRMISTAGFVIVMIIFYKIRSILGHRIDNSAGPLIAAVFVVFCPLSVQSCSFAVPGFFAVK